MTQDPAPYADLFATGGHRGSGTRLAKRMKQAVGLPAINWPNEPRALPWADMKQAFGLEGQTGDDGFSTPTASVISAQGNALGSSANERCGALKARLIESKVRRIQREMVAPELHVKCGQALQRGLTRHERAFSLIEIMVAVALMTVIVLGLLSVFNTTQRAFRSSMAQVDYLATGRATTEILARDLNEMAPSQMAEYRNGRMTNCLNFYAELSPSFANPLRQGLPGTVSPTGSGGQDSRTNIVENLFFLSKANLTWTGTGYAVLPTLGNSGVGTLYRFSTNTTKSGAQSLSGLFYNAVQIEVQNALNGLPITSVNGFEVDRIAEGVVHLRVRSFATNGYPVVANPYNRAFLNGYFRYTHMTNDYRQVRNVIAAASGLPDQVNCYFYSNAVPAFVELELGMIEQSVLDRVKGMGAVNGAAQRQYLSNHVAQVHLFRQRIPIRNVDFSAYQ